MLALKNLKLENTNAKVDYLVVFDGVCNFCNFWVKWLLKRDKERLFKFTALQSESGKKLQLKLLSDFEKLPDSIIYVEHGKVYFKSRAVFMIGRKLNFPFNLISKALLNIGLYRFYDVFYDLIANRRYFLFGKKSACMVPSQKELSRFI